jgi:DNA-binding PadR family transcriptional regulator
LVCAGEAIKANSEDNRKRYFIAHRNFRSTRLQHIGFLVKKLKQALNILTTNTVDIIIITTFDVNISTMGQYNLGEFEEIVLLTVAILNGEAYGVSIIAEIESRLDRNVSLGAIQTVLKRLEGKKLVKSAFGEATKVRGGKRKRLYEITAKGQQILNRAKEQRISLWKAIPKSVLKLS